MNLTYRIRSCTMAAMCWRPEATVTRGRTRRCSCMAARSAFPKAAGVRLLHLFQAGWPGARAGSERGGNCAEHALQPVPVRIFGSPRQGRSADRPRWGAAFARSAGAWFISCGRAAAFANLRLEVAGIGRPDAKVTAAAASQGRLSYGSQRSPAFAAWAAAQLSRSLP